MTPDRTITFLLPVIALLFWQLDTQPLIAGGAETVQAPAQPAVTTPQPSSQGQASPSNFYRTVRVISSSSVAVGGAMTANPTGGSAHPMGNAGSVAGMNASGGQLNNNPVNTSGNGPTQVVPGFSAGSAVTWNRMPQQSQAVVSGGEPTAADVVACQSRISEAEKALAENNWPKAHQEIIAAKQMNPCDTQKERIKAILEQIDKEAQRRLEQAQSLQEQGKSQEAVKCYQEIVTLFPNRPAAATASTAIAKIKNDPKYSQADNENKAKELEAQLNKLLGAKPSEQSPGQATQVIEARPDDKDNQKDVNARVRQLKSIPPETQAKALYLIETLGGKFASTEPGKRAAVDLVEIKKDSALYDSIISARDQATRTARLTLARSYRDSDMTEKASEVYNQIISNWPASAEAKQAKEELDKMLASKKTVIEVKN